MPGFKLAAAPGCTKRSLLIWPGSGPAPVTKAFHCCSQAASKRNQLSGFTLSCCMTKALSSALLASPPLPLPACGDKGGHPLGALALPVTCS
eukprot:5582240-Amphidinium_carterae.1